MSVIARRTQWDELLEAARDHSALFQAPAYVGLLRLLTIGGIVPYRSAVEGLTFRERSLLQHLLGRDELRLLPPGPEDADVSVAQSAQGKVTLHEPGRGDRPEEADVVARLRVPRWLTEMVDEETSAQEALEAHERARLDDLLRAWQADGSLSSRLDAVIDWVERVETVLVYVGRRVFSRSDAGSSTLIRAGLLPALRARGLDEWSREERLFVAAAQLLFRTGRAVRFEEFNGRQLTATGLRQLLLRRCCVYREAAGLEDQDDLHGRSTAQLAELAGELVARVDASRRIRYRRVCGPTFAKDEFLLDWPRADRQQPRLPPLLARLGRDEQGDAPGAVRRLTADAVRDGDTGRLHLILEAIVLGAVLDTDADYGMSSGVRDLVRLQGDAGLVAEILTLRKPDFLCCVLPSPTMARAMPGPAVADILWQVAQRMMYNRWHFVPGNFERSEIPLQRHYFFPPLVPDIAEWSDLRHGGHTSSKVRYTLRAPGAAMWNPPFTAFGHPYRGCFDVRAVRMEGPPFTMRELRIACLYSALIDAFWRELLAHVEDRDGPSPVFTGYDREWYQSERWRETLARLTTPDEERP